MQTGGWALQVTKPWPQAFKQEPLFCHEILTHCIYILTNWQDSETLWGRRPDKGWSHCHSTSDCPASIPPGQAKSSRNYFHACQQGFRNYFHACPWAQGPMGPGPGPMGPVLGPWALVLGPWARSWPYFLLVMVSTKRVQCKCRKSSESNKRVRF